jgi:hypothetical protein
MKPIVAEVELEKAHEVSWLEFKEIGKRKVILVGYLDG